MLWLPHFWTVYGYERCPVLIKAWVRDRAILACTGTGTLYPVQVSKADTLPSWEAETNLSLYGSTQTCAISRGGTSLRRLEWQCTFATCRGGDPDLTMSDPGPASCSPWFVPAHYWEHHGFLLCTGILHCKPPLNQNLKTGKVRPSLLGFNKQWFK